MPIQTGKLAKRVDTDAIPSRSPFTRLLIKISYTDSFYFSLTSDITNTLQRRYMKNGNNQNDFHWKNVDDRFFWNKFMLRDLINTNDSLYDPWILPITQGYIQIENCQINTSCGAEGDEPTVPKYENFKLILISRRSRHRAGTRYKRRGVDEDGHCANYVETEQILVYQHHKVSFVQIRGSVPVFWSQPGYKYRPPPRLDRGSVETQVVFEKHFKQEIETYGPVCVVNLVEQTGKEKIIWDAYTNHLLTYDDPNITYASFDFHEYCRGMRFENVSYLIASLADIIREMNYSWIDKEGMICFQNGVFRINCIDCLDRTNVVQTAIAKSVMEIQLTKLGLIIPDGQIPHSLRNTFQLLWANNGDIISKQYAGTNALKGDYTRTGERKFTGLMKDGMNSANRYCRVHLLDSYRQAALDLTQGKDIETIDLLNRLTNDIALATDKILNLAIAIFPKITPEVVRAIPLAQELQLFNAIFHVTRYYLSRFKDAYRQATIDMMLGNDVTEDLINTDRKQEEEDSNATAEHVKLLIEDCKKLLINNPDLIVGSWGLIDADPITGDPSETEMDTILILTRHSYFVAEYDEQIDRVTKYQEIQLKDLKMIELGPISTTVQIPSVFKLNRTNVSNQFCIRIHYSVSGEDGYFHMFRSTNLRFFNNMAVIIKTPEEILESLKAICETFLVALEIAGLPPVMYMQGRTLEKKKSKILDPGNSCRLGSYLDLGLTQGLTRNASETQLVTLRSAGTKALSNITQQFSKINKFGQSLRKTQQQKTNIRPKDQSLLPIFSVESVSSSKISSPTSRRSSDLSDDSYENSQWKVHPTLREKHLHHPHAGVLMKNESQNSGIFRTENLSSLLGEYSVSKVVESTDVSVRRKPPLFHSKTDVVFDSDKLDLPLKNFANTSERREWLSTEKDSLKRSNNLQINRQFSHSANEIEEDSNKKLKDTIPHLVLTLDKRSSSERDLALTIVTSQSENAFRSFKTNIANVITSPVSVTKDMLSPLSKFAKGMHHLGANLDPRKFKVHNSMEPAYKISESHLDEIRRLEERWKNSKIRLIAL